VSIINLFENISLFHKNFSNVKEKRRKEINEGKEKEKVTRTKVMQVKLFKSK